jgi:hypothetical protein
MQMQSSDLNSVPRPRVVETEVIADAFRSRRSSVSASVSAWSSDPDVSVLDLDSLVFSNASDAASLRRVLNDPHINMVSADIQLNSAGVPVIAQSKLDVPNTWLSWAPRWGRDNGCNDNLTLETWARAIAAAGRGIRVCFHDWQTLAPALAVLRTVPGAAWRTPEEDEWEANKEAFEGALEAALEESAGRSESSVKRSAGAGAAGGVGVLPLLRVPQRGALFGIPALYICADVINGPVGPHADEAAPPATFNPAGAAGSPAAQVAAARAFLRAVGEALPLAIVSLGWTTSTRAEGRGAAGGSRALFYDDACVDMMEAACREAAVEGTRVALALRASYVRETLSRGLLSRLISGVPGASLIIWSPATLPLDEISWLRRALPKEITAWAIDASSGAAAARASRDSASRDHGVILEEDAAEDPVMGAAKEGATGLEPTSVLLCAAAVGAMTAGIALAVLRRA